MLLMNTLSIHRPRTSYDVPVALPLSPNVQGGHSPVALPLCPDVGVIEVLGHDGSRRDEEVHGGCEASSPAPGATLGF